MPDGFFGRLKPVEGEPNIYVLPDGRRYVKIAHMRLSPKKIVYRRADLDEYKQSCHVAAKRSPAPAA